MGASSEVTVLRLFIRKLNNGLICNKANFIETSLKCLKLSYWCQFQYLFVSRETSPTRSRACQYQRVEAELGGVIMQMFKSEEMDE